MLLSYKLLDGETARPALVFLHGLFGSKTNFNSIAKALAQQTGRRVSFRERRGPREVGPGWAGLGRWPRRAPLFRPHYWTPGEEWPVSLSRNEEVDLLRMQATWHTVALCGPIHSVVPASIQSFIRVNRSSS